MQPDLRRSSSWFLSIPPVHPALKSLWKPQSALNLLCISISTSAHLVPCLGMPSCLSFQVYSFFKKRLKCHFRWEGLPDHQSQN